MKKRHILFFEAVIIFLAFASLCVMKAHAGDVDWDLNAGARYTRGVEDFANPNLSSFYLEGKVCPFKLSDHVYAGIFGKVVEWVGESPDGSEWDGDRLTIGPVAKIAGKNKDMEVKFFYGWQEKSWRSYDGNTETESSAGLIGISFEPRFYGREKRGEPWLSRTELYGEIMLPISRKNDKTDSIINLGVREFIYDFESIPVRTYAGATWSAESPADPKWGIYVGLKDKWGIFSINAGPRFDTGNGATYYTVGVNVGLGNLVRHAVHHDNQSSTSTLGME